MADLQVFDLLAGIVVAAIGAIGGLGAARVKSGSDEKSDLTQRFDTLLDAQGAEITRLSMEMRELRTDFKKEQKLTEELKEESAQWRSLLQVALTYLRRLHNWEREGAPPPPPTMPPELVDKLWEDL